jgi:HAD superfamily hydrolase (TIGR01509 family)
MSYETIATAVRDPEAGGGPALIFDLDGVIVDSNPVHIVCWREYLRRNGIAAPEGFEQRMFGRRNDDIVRDLFGDGLEPEEVARHGADKEAFYRETMGPALRDHLLPGLTAFLERHRDRPMAVATNGEPANAAFVLDAGGLRAYFRAVVDGHQVERPKPDPQIYLRTAEILRVRPQECVVFEDSYAGVAAAAAAGARVVGVTTTHADLPGVELRIQDFLDPRLEPWLQGQQVGP